MDHKLQLPTGTAPAAPHPIAPTAPASRPTVADLTGYHDITRTREDDEQDRRFWESFTKLTERLQSQQEQSFLKPSTTLSEHIQLVHFIANCRSPAPSSFHDTVRLFLNLMLRHIHEVRISHSGRPSGETVPVVVMLGQIPTWYEEHGTEILSRFRQYLKETDTRSKHLSLLGLLTIVEPHSRKTVADNFVTLAFSTAAVLLKSHDAITVTRADLAADRAFAESFSRLCLGTGFYDQASSIPPSIAEDHRPVLDLFCSHLAKLAVRHPNLSACAAPLRLTWRRPTGLTLDDDDLLWSPVTRAYRLDHWLSHLWGTYRLWLRKGYADRTKAIAESPLAYEASSLASMMQLDHPWGREAPYGRLDAGFISEFEGIANSLEKQSRTSFLQGIRMPGQTDPGCIRHLLRLLQVAWYNLQRGCNAEASVPGTRGARDAASARSLIFRRNRVDVEDAEFWLSKHGNKIIKCLERFYTSDGLVAHNEAVAFASILFQDEEFHADSPAIRDRSEHAMSPSWALGLRLSDPLVESKFSTLRQPASRSTPERLLQMCLEFCYLAAVRHPNTQKRAQLFMLSVDAVQAKRWIDKIPALKTILDNPHELDPSTPRFTFLAAISTLWHYYKLHLELPEDHLEGVLERIQLFHISPRPVQPAQARPRSARRFQDPVAKPVFGRDRRNSLGNAPAPLLGSNGGALAGHPANAADIRLLSESQSDPVQQHATHVVQPTAPSLKRSIGAEHPHAGPERPHSAVAAHWACVGQSSAAAQIDSHSSLSEVHIRWYPPSIQAELRAMVTMTLNPLDELLKHAIQWQPAKWPVASQKIELAAVNELAPSMPLQSTSKVLLPPTPPPSSPVAASDGFAADWPSSIHRVGSGFYNQGNTCYLNATLQVLVHSPAFVTALLLHREHTTANCDVRPFCALCAMYFLMQGAFTGNRTVKGPAAFIGYLRKIAPHFRPGRQEDAHEFLRFLLDAMQSNCLAAFHPATLKQRPSLKDTTLIHRLFAGKFRSRVSCLQCRNNSDTFDTFLDLSVHVNNLPSLRAALGMLVKADDLRGQNKYKCERCKKLVDARKELSIHDAPHILTIHLKRFTPAGRKITTALAFEEFLNLKPYMSDEADAPRYRLDGIISHAGGGPHSGHYFSHIRGPGQRWHKMDDSSVQPHTSGVKSLLGLRTAYILLYTRLDADQSDDPVRVEPVSAFIGPQQPKRKREDGSSQITDPSQSTPPANVANPFTLKKPRLEEDVGVAMAPMNVLQPVPPMARHVPAPLNPKSFYGVKPKSPHGMGRGNGFHGITAYKG